MPWKVILGSKSASLFLLPVCHEVKGFSHTCSSPPQCSPEVHGEETWTEPSETMRQNINISIYFCQVFGHSYANITNTNKIYFIILCYSKNTKQPGKD
jgi:hypothetical protein